MLLAAALVVLLPPSGEQPSPESAPRETMPLTNPQEAVELGGATGVVEVTNISGEALTAPVYIYYKNTAQDLFYGCITYRVALEQGLAAGETIRLPAGHYDPEGSTFVMAACAG